MVVYATLCVWSCVGARCPCCALFVYVVDSLGCGWCFCCDMVWFVVLWFIVVCVVLSWCVVLWSGLVCCDVCCCCGAW